MGDELGRREGEVFRAYIRETGTRERERINRWKQQMVRWYK
jgi:hypothetical protein